MRSPLLAIAASVFLAACGGGQADVAGPVSEDETQALRKAAEMLEDPREAAAGTEPGTEAERGEASTTIESEERKGV